MYRILNISIDELWLKGKNQKKYFRALKDHVKNVVKTHGSYTHTLKIENQRLVLRMEEVIPANLLEVICLIPGIHSISPVRQVEFDEDLDAAVLEELASLEQMPKTFKVEGKRVNKSYPKNSMELARHIGGVVLRKYDGTGLKVDVKAPEMVISIRVLQERIFISTKTYPATGGLPVGTSGHVVTMLSGGFDSPVASYLMARRGCSQAFVFFYAYPFVGDEVKEKIIDLVTRLGKFQYKSKLFIVPFGEAQQAISDLCLPEYRTLLFRRYMIEAANLIADKVRASAILTGDALGQVSSQTIGNISALDSTSTRPIFRPLLGTNKSEIIKMARNIGTHDISIRPHDDACSLFAPKHPIINPDRSYFDNFDKEGSITPIIQSCVDESEIYEVNCLGELSDSVRN